jgi:iron complex outermembrane recepter protein
MRLIKIFFLLFILVSISSQYSIAEGVNNNTLSGKVTDATSGQPLAGATIIIADLHNGAVTDVNGNYKLTDLPEGNYLVEIKYIGYKSITKNIAIKGDVIQNFSLELSPVEQNEVVVTGQSRATQIRKSPVPLVAISSQYLEQNLSSNIIDAIAKVPGVDAVTTGPNISKPFIRGLGYNRVLTLYDGQRQEGQQWGDEHGIEVDQYNIGRIEIVKGPASLTYGSDAIAGVVNLIPDQPAPDGKIIGQVLSEYQTNNGLIGNSVMVSGNKKGFSWLVRASHKMAKNYRDKQDGWVYATNYRETDATALFGLTRDWGYSHLDLTLYDDLQAIPDGSRDSVTRQFTKQITEADTFRPVVPYDELNTYNLPVLHQHVQHYRVYSSNSFNIGRGQLLVNVGFERSVRREFSHPQYGDIPGLFLQLNSYTYGVKYNFPDWNGWELTLGDNGMYQTNSTAKATEFIIPSYHEFDAGPFFLLKKTINKLDIVGGLRYDTRLFHNYAIYTKPNPVTGFDMEVYGADTLGADRPFNDYKHNFAGVTGSFGMTYNFNERLSVKANIARGYRAPNISEISANGVHPGTDIYQIGNPDFNPEFSLEEDLGMAYASDHVSFSADVFNNDIQNYIYNQKVLNSRGQDSVIVPGNETYKFQQGHARLYGFELSLDIHPHPLDWLHFENTLSAVYALNEAPNANVKALGDSAKYLPFIPPLHGTSTLRANIKFHTRHLQNAFVKVDMDYYATQNRVYLVDNTETRTGGYTLFDAGAGTDIANASGKELFNVSVFVNNIFNKVYQDHLSRLKYMEEYPDDPRGHLGIYNMGVNVGFRVTVPLDFN